MAEVVRRLRMCLRAADVVAQGANGLLYVVAVNLRLVGDLQLVAERVRTSLTQPYLLRGGEVQMLPTIGGICQPDSPIDATTLRGLARDAMTDATIRISPAAPSNAGSAQPLLGEGDDQGQAADGPAGTSLFGYHPTYSRSSELVGAKAVADVARFIAMGKQRETSRPHAAGGGRERLGDQILQALMDDIKQLSTAPHFELPISILIAAPDMQNPELSHSIQRMLADTGTSPARIEVLFTEEMINMSPDTVKRNLTRLRNAGVNSCLCGFDMNKGTRLHLRKLPISALRMSCDTFSKGSSRSQNIWLVRSIIAVAKRNGVSFIAEDVNSEEQDLVLRESECEWFEGSRFSNVLTLENLREQLSEASFMGSVEAHVA